MALTVKVVAVVAIHQQMTTEQYTVADSYSPAATGQGLSFTFTHHISPASTIDTHIVTQPAEQC